jgi:hypothetical protein
MLCFEPAVTALRAELCDAACLLRAAAAAPLLLSLPAAETTGVDQKLSSKSLDGDGVIDDALYTISASR